MRYLGTVDTFSSSIPAHRFRIHYSRPDKNYEGWKAYIFGDTTENTGDYYQASLSPVGQDSFGVFYEFAIPSAAQHVGLVIHNPGEPGGDRKDVAVDLHLGVGQAQEAWISSGDPVVYLSNPNTAAYTHSQAYWIDRDTVVIPPEHYESGCRYRLLYSREGQIQKAHLSAETIALSAFSGALSAEQLERFPQLAHYAVFKLASTPSDVIKRALECQLALLVVDASETIRYITGMQIAGVLDDLFPYSGTLGASYSADKITVRLWAPTAQSVELLLHRQWDATEADERLEMIKTDGVWAADVPITYKGAWYLYDVKVYVPSAQLLVNNRVTDPYSVDLALNGCKSRFTDLNDPRDKPPEWEEDRSPKLATFNDLSLYELHVRDFSVADATVPEGARGTYLAFTHPEANGAKHLAQLAAAGLKAIHLLPTFHFSSVNEDKSTWKSPGDLSRFAPDSTEQQAAISRIKDEDGYNWGYDPVHYMAPTGAYASNPDQRVIEYRHMVQSLHKTGLRIIQDAVFNHTSGSGQTESSILDKIVPTYYHRLDRDGKVHNSTCCSNTASEHKMMEKLMVDTLVTQAQHYKIDGFRFDLMNFHTLANMRRIREVLSNLTLEANGVIGSDIYLYGEGWSFGEIVATQPANAATQPNLHGTGIGTFNDRVRDAVRGGNPFTDQRTPGFATGLTDSAELQRQADLIKLSMAGNLRDYRFTDRGGRSVTGGEVDFLGQGAGYAASPVETVNYCSVHDNQTLFDAVQLKSPAGEDTATRARRHVLAMSLIALGQGIPFFMAGDDLLRSKDMDGNSYNSGDWFNKIDWSYQSNNWGIGLPMARDNRERWPIQQPLLANSALKPSPRDIEFSRLAFQEFLRIRYSSPLFRLQTAAQVQNQLRFLPAGPGVLVMLLVGTATDSQPFHTVVVACNATREAITYQDNSLKGLGLRLHSEQSKSHDPVVRQAAAEDSQGILHLPLLTTAVFVSPG